MRARYSTWLGVNGFVIFRPLLWRHNGPASRLFTQPFIQAQIKENIISLRMATIPYDFLYCLLQYIHFNGLRKIVKDKIDLIISFCNMIPIYTYHDSRTVKCKLVLTIYNYNLNAIIYQQHLSNNHTLCLPCWNGKVLLRWSVWWYHVDDVIYIH